MQCGTLDGILEQKKKTKTKTEGKKNRKKPAEI